jgi:predicted Zn finger-like uncharacterized protein
MPATFIITCPECEKQLKVSEEVIGKKIRCKECKHVFEVKKPKAAVATKGKKQDKPSQEDNVLQMEKRPEELSAKEIFQKQLQEEEDAGENPYDMGQIEEGIARCPRCAGELESDEAVICLHCGFNTRTRNMATRTKVYENTGGDIFKWRLPGIVCILISLGIVIFDIICWRKMDVWLLDTFLFGEDKKWLIHPNAFNLYVTLFFIACIIPMMRFAIRRLFINSQPPERELK